MSRQHLPRFVFLLACGLALAGCAAQPAPAVEPAPSLVVLETASPAPSPVVLETASPAPETAAPPGRGPLAPPTPAFLEIATPSPQPSQPFFLGVPAGDAYDLSSMAVDPAGGRAVVYARASGAGGPVIAVVDLAGGEVLRLIPLRSEGYPSDGKVLLSPDGRQGYAVNRDAAVLTLFDPNTGALGPTVDGVTEAALSPDGKRLYAVMGREGLRAFATTAFGKAGRATPLWSVTDAPYVELALNGEVLAATRGGAAPALVTFDAATGRQTGSAPLAPADVTSGLAPGPAGGWLISTGYSPARLVRLDADLRVAAEAEALSGADPYYDAPRGRYLIVGWATDSSDRLVMSYAEDDLAPTTVVKGARADLSDVFAPYGDDVLLGLRRHDGARLSFLDATNLSSTRDVILGVKLADMALDEAGQRLYVADDQDRIHLLSLPDGEVRAVWDGAAPIALDTANRRLYVNRASGVVALDSTTGREVARFPQTGMPAPDPNRDLVYIADAGVTIYDRAGAQVGRLDSTFPVERGMNPNPFAFAARVNPVNGILVTIFNNGSPGSSNRSYLRFYPPQADRPITVTGAFTFVGDLAFDPGGDLLVSHSNAMNMEALQRLDSAGHERSRLGGRTGALALDSAKGLLYVAGAGALARVPVLPVAHGPGDAGAMQLLDLYGGPSGVSQALLHAGLRQLFLRTEDSSHITVLNPDELPPIDMRPVAVAGLPPDADISALDFLEADGKLTLYATTLSGEHYKTSITPGSDGSDLGWERLPVGSLPAWGRLTVAGDVLFRAGPGEYGGDGVFRSRDGGDSWELLAAGLTDLRPAQPVRALGADKAYYVGRTGGILGWRPGTGAAGGRWERILTPAQDPELPGDLSLAPDGTLFLQTWGRLQRSTDGGRTWRDLPVPADSRSPITSGGNIAGFDPEYAQTQTLFTLYCASEACQVTRSRDGGQTQQPVFGLPPYSSPLKLLSQGRNPPAGDGALYLYSGGYPGTRLYRSLDRGAAWQTADLGALPDTYSAAVAPDGRLWLGTRGSVQAIDPRDLPWSPISSAPPPLRSPAPIPTPCAQGLPDLGCPLSPEQPVAMAHQPFQRGRMVWIGSGSGLGDWEKVVVVLNGAGTSGGGTWQRFSDAWQEGQPEADPALVPPEGLVQPVRGFGVAWREQLGGPQASIGWATAPEEGVPGTIQPYQGGTVLRLGDELLLLVDSGRGWRSER